MNFIKVLDENNVVIRTYERELKLKPLHVAQGQLLLHNIELTG